MDKARSRPGVSTAAGAPVFARESAFAAKARPLTSGPPRRGRGKVLAAAILIQIGIGSVYAWSVFQAPLAACFPAWSEGRVTLPAQIVLAVFALAVIAGGRWTDRFGPRAVATVGGLLLGAGVASAGLAGRFGPGPALVWLVGSYSVLGGAGIGLGYIASLASAVRRFPEKRGAAAGLTVAGFGAGAFLFAPLADALIGGGRYSLLGLPLFSVPAIGVWNTFFALGLTFFVVVSCAARFLDGAKTEDNAADCPAWTGRDMPPRRMMRTPQFWILWTAMAAACAAGLQIIMKAAPLWRAAALKAAGPFVVASAAMRTIGVQSALIVSLLAAANAAGRIAGGRLSDAIGRKASLVSLFLLCGAVFFALGRARTFGAFAAAASCVGLCYGGLLAVFPSLTADYFGARHYGANWGWMFSAFGVGGWAGPFLAARLMKIGGVVRTETFVSGRPAVAKAAVSDYRAGFLVGAGLCLAAAAAVFFLRPPRRD